MNTVYYSQECGKLFLDKLKSELAKEFKGCKKIAIKMHFGEAGNTKAFTSKDVEPITRVLQDLGFEHFLYDSSVMYGGPRSNPVTHKVLAIAKGFRNVELGDEFIEVEGKHLTYQVCRKLSDADGVLVLSHIKGHVCSGFGGAIKNLGMGALTKHTKTEIHEGGKPIFGEGCKKCGICVKKCPIGGLKLDAKDEKPVIKQCFGCSNCVYVCPHKIAKAKTAPFDILLAEGAAMAQSQFKKAYYVSAMKNISEKCDCVPLSGKIIAEDAGYLMCKDGVSADMAAYSIIKEQSGEVFLEHNKKNGTAQIDAAEKFGMGNKKYVLQKLI